MEYAADESPFKSPFGAMLSERRKSANMSTVGLAEAAGPYGAVNHGGAVANWEAGRNVPSKEQYSRLKAALSEAGAEDIPDYEDGIRPFNVSKDVEFTDVWTFEIVRQHKGKHPAERSVDLPRHDIEATSCPGDIVLDCFSGSGSTGVAVAAL